MFKKDVYQTNHIDVEKHLLLHEGLRQSVRLLLMDAFKEDEPTITEVVKELYRNCPTLFQVLITRSEQTSLLAEQGSEEEEDTMTLQSDKDHRDVTAIGRLGARYCKNTLRVPLRASDALMTTYFKS